MGAKQPGPKKEWGRDIGSVPGHPIKHPGMMQPGQVHTPYQSRGWSEDKGSNTRPDSYHTNSTNRVTFREDDMGPNRSRSSHNPLPAGYKRQDGLDSDGDTVRRRSYDAGGRGHKLVRRGGTGVFGLKRGWKD